MAQTIARMAESGRAKVKEVSSLFVIDFFSASYVG